MRVSDVYLFLDNFCPFDTQEDFDNAGLLAGDMDREISKIGICLDITKENIEKAKNLGCDLIVSHHPVIFAPIKSISFDSKVALLCKYGISAICAHTNLDKAKGGVNDVLCNALGLRDVKAVGESSLARVGKLEKPMSAEDFAQFLKNALNTSVRFSDNKKLISTVGLCGGAGADFMYDADADCFVTGEIKHHQWLESDKPLFDCGHFPTEILIVKTLFEKLSKEFENVVIIEEQHPYQTI